MLIEHCGAYRRRVVRCGIRPLHLEPYASGYLGSMLVHVARIIDRGGSESVRPIAQAVVRALRSRSDPPCIPDCRPVNGLLPTYRAHEG